MTPYQPEYPSHRKAILIGGFIVILLTIIIYSLVK